MKDKLPEFFIPLGQVGVAVRGGAEAAVHSVRQALAKSAQNIVLKVDFENAFNAVDREALFAHLSDHFPELVRWFHFTYNDPAFLFSSGARLRFTSSVGVRQGGPLGPFLLHLPLRPLPSLEKRPQVGRLYLSVVP